MIMAETCKDPAASRTSASWGADCSAAAPRERFGAQFQSHQTLSAKQKSLASAAAPGAPIDLTESRAPLSGLHETRHVVHGALGLRRLRDSRNQAGHA